MPWDRKVHDPNIKHPESGAQASQPFIPERERVDLDLGSYGFPERRQSAYENSVIPTSQSQGQPISNLTKGLFLLGVLSLAGLGAEYGGLFRSGGGSAVGTVGGRGPVSGLEVESVTRESNVSASPISPSGEQDILDKELKIVKDNLGSIREYGRGGDLLDVWNEEGWNKALESGNRGKRSIASLANGLKDVQSIVDCANGVIDSLRAYVKSGSNTGRAQLQQAVQCLSAIPYVGGTFTLVNYVKDGDWLGAALEGTDLALTLLTPFAPQFTIPASAALWFAKIILRPPDYMKDIGAFLDDVDKRIEAQRDGVMDTWAEKMQKGFERDFSNERNRLFRGIVRGISREGDKNRRDELLQQVYNNLTPKEKKDLRRQFLSIHNWGDVHDVANAFRGANIQFIKLYNNMTDPWMREVRRLANCKFTSWKDFGGYAANRVNVLNDKFKKDSLRAAPADWIDNSEYF